MDSIALDHDAVDFAAPMPVAVEAGRPAKG